ncbi:MAG: GDP-mannose 4,6-dehydratase, partial [Lachnospiraceae bacterium]|nr:GDP-mannose 4,6-dehydratase [Lachnospiraceae bacterium]
NSSCVRSFLNVTTDKVYMNLEQQRGYTENDELDGFDPYSNSKSCSELVTRTYKRSFWKDDLPAISTARAGNVIGGGDFAHDRIIPDCVRAACAGEDIIIRNPHSTRPFQHVLEPLCAYLMIVQRQYEDPSLAGSYNVGPDASDCVTAGQMADLFVRYWGDGIRWIDRSDNGPHEAGFLHLDCTLLKNTFSWQPRWNIETAMQKTVEWYKLWHQGGDLRTCMDEQISEYLADN